MISRRDLLRLAALGLVPGCGAEALDGVLATPALACSMPPPPSTRGAVLVVDDMTLDWPSRAAQAGLTTLAIHARDPSNNMIAWMRSADGRRLVDRCCGLGIAVEYEVHVLHELLPRSLFPTKPWLFPLDDNGQRTPTGDLCVHQPEALSLVAENAVRFCRELRATSERYFLWRSDTGGFCRCTDCAPLSPSDQMVVVENAILAALRAELSPAATLAHLAYGATLLPPVEVRPSPGVFLEYAPIERRMDLPLADAGEAAHVNLMKWLHGNLSVFGTAGSQALDYWLDASLASHWTRPSVKLAFDSRILAADVATYRAAGVEHITTFATWLDADYEARFGPPPIAAYGAALRT